MKRKILFHIFFLVSFFPILPFHAVAQQGNVLQYVNPFIGTAKSNVYTRWGNEGGTYPGAVAPWGAMQLTPETRGSGYDYKDSSIHFFSCLQHHSGFPGGSGGRLHIMPFEGTNKKDYGAVFHHANEQAQPGYYSVTFDNKIKVEATATTHTGLFRITFPPYAIPAVLIDDAGDISLSSSQTIKATKYNAVLHFDKIIIDTERTEEGCIVHFASAQTGNTILTIQLSASPVGFENAQQNIEAELASFSFDDIRTKAEDSWQKELSVVSINDSSIENKTSFYTALYHSLLLPWIISDANGYYRGSDNAIHKTNGKHEYSGFSPWDTFRSLHPLLSLLYPDRQNDMMLSMLDIYQQSGYLPVESMTGNHSIPILVDSYLKGIKPVDSLLLYNAMKKSIVTGPFIQPDMTLYQQGFIPYPHTESVTRTVEYAYDDWVLAQYATHVMHDENLTSMLIKRSHNYRNLFDADELSLLPRKNDTLYHGTANAGYKEGDQWVYTLFLPQYQQDLINRFGGDENFIQQIDNELADNRLVFDNETMFHVPYLFNSTAYPYKTQQWIAAIRKCFSATPGGLPGNDDLGSTSSWFVWSALGFYPVCPGNPVYAIGTPLFKEATIFLPNKKTLQIQAGNVSENNFYVKNIKINEDHYEKNWLTHQAILDGGKLAFTMDSLPDKKIKKSSLPGELDKPLQTSVSNVLVSAKTVKPDELFQVKYTIRNQGGKGTAIMKLTVDDSLIFTKHCYVEVNEIKHDSIACRLYAYGKHTLHLEGESPVIVQVIRSNQPTEPFVSNLQVSPIVKKGSQIHYQYTVKNKSGEKKVFAMPVRRNESTSHIDTITLPAGDSMVMTGNITADKDGLYTLNVADKKAVTKVYHLNTEALILNIPNEVMYERTAIDQSGFSNNGRQSAFGNYIELPHTASLDSNGTALTMMEWVYDSGTNKPLTELLAKGDNHVLQLVDGSSLTFFAGGWGRGDCTVALPAGWRNHWHHIAGVCNGKDLRVYIDGELKGVSPLEEMISLNVAARWTIGNNEEFPLDRLFGGKIKGIKIYAAPLTAEEVQTIYPKEKQSMAKE